MPGLGYTGPEDILHKLRVREGIYGHNQQTMKQLVSHFLWMPASSLPCPRSGYRLYIRVAKGVDSVV